LPGGTIEGDWSGVRKTQPAVTTGREFVERTALKADRVLTGATADPHA